MGRNVGAVARHCALVRAAFLLVSRQPAQDRLLAAALQHGLSLSVWLIGDLEVIDLRFTLARPLVQDFE